MAAVRRGRRVLALMLGGQARDSLCTEVSKFDEFAHICQLLDARSPEVAEVQEFSEAGDQTGLITFNADAISGDAESGSKQFKRMAQAFRASWTWEPVSPTRNRPSPLQ